MLFRSTFVRTVSRKKHYVGYNFTFHPTNVIYLVKCVTCKCQNIGSATSFKQHFHIHKSDIKTKKDRCGIASHFNFTCCSPINLHGYLKVQLIEQVLHDANKDIESISWGRDKN